MPVGDSVTLNGYTITLTDIDNGSCPTAQTWTYTVERTGTPANAISFWALDIDCPTPHIILATDPTDAEFTDPVCLDDPPPTRDVVKWNIQNGDQFQSGTFSFTLQGCFGEQQRDVALHAGGTCFFGQITGPSCDEATTTTTSTTTTTTTTTTTSTTSTTTTTTALVTRGVKLFNNS